MSKNLLAILILSLCSVCTMRGQYVKMVVSDYVSGPAFANNASSMKSMVVETYYTPDLVVSNVRTGEGMMNSSTFLNQKDSTFIIYMSINDEKIKVMPTSDEYLAINNASSKKKKQFTCQPVPGNKKDILGFSCYLYQVVVDDTINVKLYITPEIDIKADTYQGLEQIAIKGFPLEYTIESQGNSVTFTTQKFEKNFDPSNLELPIGNYKTMTYSEFNQFMTTLMNN